MSHLISVGIERVRKHRVPADPLEGERADKMRRRPGHDDMHILAGFQKQPEDFDGLIGRDASRNTEEDHILYSSFFFFFLVFLPSSAMSSSGAKAAFPSPATETTAGISS